MNKVITFLFLFLVNFAFSQETYVREYWYNASENDSKLDARYSALTEMKRQLIEEIGVLVSTKTDLYNKNGESDIEIKTKIISESITKTNIIDEKWNGDVYYIKAKITINENDIIKRLNRIDIDYNDKVHSDNYKKDELNKKNKKIDDVYYAKFSFSYQYSNNFLSSGMNFGIISYDIFDIGLYGRGVLSEVGEKNYYDYGMVIGLSKRVGSLMIDLPLKIGSGDINLDGDRYNQMVIISPSIDIGIGLGDDFYLMSSIGYRYVNNMDNFDLDGFVLSLYLKKIK